MTNFELSVEKHLMTSLYSFTLSLHLFYLGCSKRLVKEYELKLFRLMHCYILSKIVLQPIHLNSVKNSLKAQNKSISQLEDVTMMHSRLAEHYMNQMRNIREIEIFPMLETLIEDRRVSKKLLEVLSYDLKKAEPIIRLEVREFNFFCSL